MSNKNIADKNLSEEQEKILLMSLKLRFEKNTNRHPDITWEDVEKRLINNSPKLWSLNEMERTGGEPDVIGIGSESGSFIFCDCSSESPAGRRSLCYDQKALEARKANKPNGSALELASAMGIEVLSEEAYKQLQQIVGSFDTKTSSWILTPSPIRELGGALFCDHRFGHVFVYHNGAESYYSARGFRGKLVV